MEGTPKNCTKNILMSQITMMVWSLTQSQTFWSLIFKQYSGTVLEKEMATHSSVLAWRIPGTSEPGGLPSMGSHRVGHD